MSGTPIKRKLVAILAADAFGYSRLMAANEEATLKLLAAHRAVIDSIIEFHEGRIVNTAGDSVIAEFASPVQAVRCAVEIQDALRTRNEALPEEKRLLFRIGVNLGDVMVKGDDLLGDGVNVAARLESIAEPGGICISSSVYDQISGKLDLGFVDVGSKSLKNIDRPVRVYRVDRDGRSRSTARRHPSAAKWLIGIAAFAAFGLGAWHFVLVPMQEEAQQAKAKAEAAARAADEERRRQEAQAKAAAEAAKRQAEVEKQRAESEAARRRAEAQLAKERAAVEAAKQRADAQAAAAAEAKRALAAQRAAEERDRAQAELARLRAEAEAAKRKAAELAASARQTAKANAPAPATPHSPKAEATPSLREGQWTVEISCPQYKRFRSRTIRTPLSVKDDAFVVQEKEQGRPGSLSLRGFLNSDGTVHFRGGGVSGRLGGSRKYHAGFAARPVGARYEGSGHLGWRECQLVLSRNP